MGHDGPTDAAIQQTILGHALDQKYETLQTQISKLVPIRSLEDAFLTCLEMLFEQLLGFLQSAVNVSKFLKEEAISFAGGG
mmetsp:Transcript_31711/g.31940  ORF Transcript_31711/g.31940 Transcript_31711/m.31940 type:complete len:81 (-) Transcript_31711:1135-1377(-)|eukprot:CAMPEP_0171322650 /NCGR_PEP_ID=MMETSP0816-20121228/115091_1 /TAXON_ID=420281 /ORGANISM="Proboscia inermis, Strain CCAP1064/1" /LENGTH=80 /DNA_ID=CAMNT_0011821179 /DNA_START=423 /DNA_END=665 /DNA_ORIENTATION=+